MCELKKAIWREYDAEIKEALSSSEKVRNIPEYRKRKKLPEKNEPARRQNILQGEMQNYKPYQGKSKLSIQKRHGMPLLPLRRK